MPHKGLTLRGSSLVSPYERGLDLRRTPQVKHGEPGHAPDDPMARSSPAKVKVRPGKKRKG